MSDLPDNPPPAKPAAFTIAAIHVVFLDVVKYSLRSASSQQKVIAAFTQLCSRVIHETLANHVSALGRTRESLAESVIKLPTGDGMAIGIALPEMTDLHLNLTRSLVSELIKHNSQFDCADFQTRNWC